MLRPKSRHLKNFGDAAAAVDELLASQITGDSFDGRITHADSFAEGDGDESATDDGSEGGERNAAAAEVDEEEEVEVSSKGVYQAYFWHQIQAPTNGSEEDDQDDIVLIREPKHEEVDTDAQAEFDREFAKMLADTTDARRGERKNAPPIFDTAVPHIKRKAEDPNGDFGKMAFTLLTKRGNKSQVRLSLLPRWLRTNCEIDALARYSCRLGDSCQFEDVSAPKQGGARTAQTLGPAE